MSHIKSDTFIDIANQFNCEPKQVLAELVNLNPSYGCNITQVRNRIENYRRKGLLPLSSGNSVSPGEFLKGTSTLFGPNGEIKSQWVKTDTKASDNFAAFTTAIENLVKGIPAYVPTDSPAVEPNMEDLLTMYPLGDVHWGMLSHEEETGSNNDLKLAGERLTSAITLAVSQALPTQEAFIVDVGDYLHADDSSNTTPRGNNPLDVDGRYHKVLETGLQTAANLIQIALTKHQKVHWRSAEGNHNPGTSVMINMFLKAYFRNEPRVVIHTSPAMHFYHQFGKCLFGITHGHTTKPDKLGELMAVDCNDLWSSTKNRYWITGHIHHTQVKEYPSCIVETFRTLTPKDAWHASMGYRSGQDTKVITYHKEHGEVSRNTISVNMLP